ncbi:MAG TPA: DUF4097 family beta strand repeat-containing protein [Streptosporangiaceae bacterium]
MTNAAIATSAPTARFPMTPARWLTLVLGVPVLLTLIGWTSFSVVDQLGQASFPVHASFPVSQHQVNVQIDGNITLRQAKMSGAQLTGTAHYSLFRSTVTVTGSTVRYHCPNPLGNCELNGTLQVPMSTAASLSTAGGDLTVPSFAGDVTLHSDGGNVNVGSLTGSLQISTAGGDVNIGTVSDPHSLLRLTTEGGNITGQHITAPQATVQTAGGDVSLKFTLPPVDLQMTADGGNITLFLPHLASGYLVSASSDGGNVRIDRSVHRNSSASGHAINVHTAGGDISISEAS